MMKQALHHLKIATSGPGLTEITAAVKEWVAQQPIETGLLTLFCRHTSASLLIQENADPDVQADLQAFFAAIAPEDRRRYRHDAEGPDDMPAHLRAALTQTQLAIPIAAGQLMLGTWQGIYLFEHRRPAHQREVVLHLIGE
jgi:secondary thiamine-phosphate synthase enzyme